MLEEDEELSEEEREFKRIKELVSEWKVEAKREKKELKLPTSGFLCVRSPYLERNSDSFYFVI